MKKVLLSQKIHEDAEKYLKDRGFFIITSPSPEDEVVRQHISDADAIIVRTATKLSRETIFAGAKLKVIARTGAGVDNVDIEAASEKGIYVCNTPEANIESVAEHAVAFMLALSKYLFMMDKSVRKNEFAVRNKYLPVDLEEKTLGLLGFGKIGRRVAQKCAGCFGMKIIYFDPYLSEDISTLYEYKRAGDMDTVFSESDFISLHMPYTKDSHHIIGSRLLSKMKPGAFIINTSRGGIIDEAALAEALSAGKICGAALDVFENEPPKEDSPLFLLENIILSPHSAALTKESAKRMAMHAAQGAADVLEGKTPKWVFNRDRISKAE
ncbi:MAG: hydroxyacid dehydrogenase [Actinobacteria bacterium]|nr:hydroxyacid dehydrogenase [Actinomycetota bacterium]